MKWFFGGVIMILLRAIKGDDYARKIEDGIITFRDVLSSITNNIETGYKFSNYNEEYFQDAFKEQLIPPTNIKEFNEELQAKLLLTFNKTIPYMYLTYFHILNKNSIEDWLNNTSDGMSYIYIEPKIDIVSNNLIGENFVGKELSYTTDINTINKRAYMIKMAGILQFINRDIIKVKDVKLVQAYTGFIRNLCFPLFHRVEDTKFNSKEKEYRLLYKLPTPINQLTREIYPVEERTFILLMDDKYEYIGKTVITNCKGDIMRCDMELTATNPLMTLRRTYLCDELKKGRNFSIISEFRDVDIRSSTKRYGYIGNKEKCIDFIKGKLKGR